MKKISKATIEQLKAIEPDTLVAHGIISEAPNHKGNYGYVCLLCGSGTGQNHNGRGDGGGSFDDDNQFFCHACSNEDVGRHKISTIDLFAISRNLPTSNFYENCQLMADEFNIPIDYDDDNTTRKTNKTSKKKVIEIKPPIVDTKELAIIRADLATSDEPLRDLFKYSGDNYLWRGLPLELLLKFGCRFIAKWKRPNQRDLDYVTPTPRMIIPCSNEAYLARLDVPISRYDDKQRQYIAEKEHAGTKKLFNPIALTSGKPIFCVEGYIDAMSIELAGFKAVALGAASRGDLLVDIVKTMERKPLIIILLDSDAQGRKDAPKLNKELIKVGCPCVVRFLADSDSKIDCNEILQTQGLDALRDILQKLVDDSATELAAVEEEILQTVPAIFSEDERDFYFGGVVTDLANARRIVKFCGDSVRWITDEERWLVYANGIWTRSTDKAAAVLPFVSTLADRLLASTELVGEEQLKRARAIAFQFQKRDSVSAAVTMMKGVDSILITAEDLDRHSNLICVLNGVLDLQEKKFYQHDSKYLITQQCRAAQIPNAQSNLVDSFFKSIQPDEMTRAGLLRWLGYCLTGDVSEEKFMVHTGGGGNGKGVLSATLLELLGSYGVGLAPTALLKSNKPIDADKPTAALNGIELARFAISEEMPADGELVTSLIKNLSGGDRINLRRLHCEYRTVKPTVKLNVSGNYTPKIENVHDDGLLRRMLNMPYLVKFGTPDNPADHSLKKKMLLQDNLNALLRLLVDNSFDWYKDGLIISDAMKQATRDNLNENDFISAFIDDNETFERGANLSVKAKDFVDALKSAYPRETSRFKRNDLIKLIAKTDGIDYSIGHGNIRVFKGIGKAGTPQQSTFDDFDGEPIHDDDLQP